MSIEEFRERVRQMQEAGQRLLAALTEEERCSELACASPADDEAFKRWARSRRRVEELQLEYADAVAACAGPVEDRHDSSAAPPIQKTDAGEAGLELSSPDCALIGTNDSEVVGYRYRPRGAAKSPPQAVRSSVLRVKLNTR